MAGGRISFLIIAPAAARPPGSRRSVRRWRPRSSDPSGSNHFVIQLTAPMIAKPIIFGSPGRNSPSSIPCWMIARMPWSKRSRLVMMRLSSGGESACRSRVSAVPCNSSSITWMNASTSLRSLSSGRRILGLHVGHQPEQDVERIIVAGVEDFFLVLEVVVEVALGHRQRRGDLVHAGAVVPAPAERRRGALQNLDAAVRSVADLGHGGRARNPRPAT